MVSVKKNETHFSRARNEPSGTDIVTQWIKLLLVMLFSYEHHQFKPQFKRPGALLVIQLPLMLLGKQQKIAQST